MSVAVCFENQSFPHSFSKSFSSPSIVSNMKLSCLVTLASLFLGLGNPFVLPNPTQNCSTFAQDYSESVASQNATIINSTLILANSAAGNNFTFCMVFGQVAYEGNNSLNFQLYLPDATAWTGRFVAVGNYSFNMNLD